MNLKELSRVSDAAHELKVEKKDWERMQDLLDKNEEGAGVAKSIKDKYKAAARYVAGTILSGSEHKFDVFKRRALELGCTAEEIKSCLDSAKIPEGFKENHKPKKDYSGYTGSLDRFLDSLESKYGVKCSRKETREAQKRWSSETSSSYHRNGRVWPLNYEVTIKRDDKEIKEYVIVITNEGGGNYGFDYCPGQGHGSQYGIRMSFKEIKNKIEQDVKDEFPKKVEDSAVLTSFQQKIKDADARIDVDVNSIQMPPSEEVEMAVVKLAGVPKLVTTITTTDGTTHVDELVEPRFTGSYKDLEGKNHYNFQGTAKPGVIPTLTSMDEETLIKLATENTATVQFGDLTVQYDLGSESPEDGGQGLEDEHVHDGEVCPKCGKNPCECGEEHIEDTFDLKKTLKRIWDYFTKITSEEETCESWEEDLLSAMREIDPESEKTPDGMHMMPAFDLKLEQFGPEDYVFFESYFE